MKLQNRVLKKYRLYFPNDTLRDVSARTNIQLTRVFRLFNGKPMKVKELEAFEEVIEQQLSTHSSYRRFQELSETAQAVFSTKDLEMMAELLERRLALCHYRTQLSSHEHETNIA
jgi:hypothetical protein